MENKWDRFVSGWPQKSGRQKIACSILFLWNKQSSVVTFGLTFRNVTCFLLMYYQNVLRTVFKSLKASNNASALGSHAAACVIYRSCALKYNTPKQITGQHLRLSKVYRNVVMFCTTRLT